MPNLSKKCCNLEKDYNTFMKIKNDRLCYKRQETNRKETEYVLK